MQTSTLDQIPINTWPPPQHQLAKHAASQQHTKKCFYDSFTGSLTEQANTFCFFFQHILTHMSNTEGNSSPLMQSSLIHQSTI